MFGAPVVTVEPPGDLVSTDEAKSFLRIDDTGFDSIVDLARKAAVDDLEKLSGLRLINQTVTVTADSFADLALFRVGPIRSLTEIAYRDSAGVNQVVDAGNYELEGAPLEQGVRLLADTWPVAEAGSIVVTLEVGYGADATTVPPPLVYAAYALLRGRFEDKDVDVGALIANYRLWLP